ncbi:MAG: RNase adapter RapZ, partial [Fusobacterium periodonticum]|nr:RNase adapter RapZ [Fusobacterium periodonticum]
LTISIGCSGGQHRSVTFVNKLAEDLKNSKILNHINIYASHREKELGHW